MNYSNLFKIAMRAISANKTRSFLTALGIIIGIASVITMLAVGQGTKRSIQSNIAEMGSNMITRYRMKKTIAIVFILIGKGMKSRYICISGSSIAVAIVTPITAA